MKLNTYLVKSTVVAALGGLLFGFDTAVISGTTSALRQTYQLSPALLGITVASALWGTIVGAMLAGFPGERYGRRKSLTGEEKTASVIGDRQWIAVLMIPQQELALVIGAPQLIRFLA